MRHSIHKTSHRRHIYCDLRDIDADLLTGSAHKIPNVAGHPIWQHPSATVLSADQRMVTSGRDAMIWLTTRVEAACNAIASFVARYGTLIRLDKLAASLSGKQYLGRIMTEHDLAIEKLRIGLNEVVRRCGRRRTLHEMAHCQDPCLRNCCMIFRHRNAVSLEKCEQRSTHSLCGRARLRVHQVDVGSTDMRPMTEAIRRKLASFELRDEAPIVG